MIKNYNRVVNLLEFPLRGCVEVVGILLKLFLMELFSSYGKKDKSMYLNEL